MKSDPETESTEDSKRLFQFPHALDQGYATVIAAIITLVGGIAVVFLSSGGQPPSVANSETATSSLPTTTVTIEPSSTPTSTPTPETTPTPEPVDTQSSDEVTPLPQPTIQILGDLFPAQQEAVQGSAAAILQTAHALPLIMRDGFDTNDYTWPEFDDIFEKGIRCAAALRESQYNISVQTTTTSGPGWCLPYAPRMTRDFLLTLDTQLTQERNTDIFVYYRYADDSNFYYLMLNPQTQLVTYGAWINGTDNLFIQSRYVPVINKTGVNSLSLLILEGSHILYINDELIATISNGVHPAEGQLRIGLRLNEAEESQELLIDNLELRGQ